jgi:NAD(P)H-hydrate epimerase
MRSLSRDEIRRADRYAIERLGIPGLILMENAGRQAADWVAETLRETGGSSVAVVAGAGNNGGDGCVVARHLGLRGWTVAAFLIAKPEKFQGDAATNVDALEALEQDVRGCSDCLDGLAEALRSFDVVVDAVGGTGIRGALRGPAARAVEQINAAGRPVVAIDIPTGLDCDTGRAEGPAVRARCTVTFLARKTGFDAPGADAYTGEVHVADIGVPAEWIVQRAAAD